MRPVPPGGGAAPDSNRRDWRTNLGLTLPCLFLYWADLWRHTLFFDEVNAWGIAAASPTLRQLFTYVHYEGHPWLWYFLLWIPSRFTHDPRGMLWIVAPVGTAIYLVIGLLSPFTRLQKVLIFLGYFVVFEYTVMNRMYGVMFLLALLYVWHRMKRPDALVANLCLLGLMANTDMTGVVLSGALLLEYAYDRHAKHANEGWNRSDRWQAIRALMFYSAMLFFSVHSMLPAPEISWQSSGRLGSQALVPRYILRVVTNGIAGPWWPISAKFPHRFWETDSMEQTRLVLLAPVVVFAYWWSFRRDRNLLLLMGLTLGFGILFADVVYVGRVRHWGIAYISFLLGLWMQRIKRERAGEPRAAAWSGWTYGLMSLSVLAGLLATGASWAHPFSQARTTAQWLLKNEPADVPLIGAPDVAFASVVAYLGRPIYFMECACTDTFKLFSRSRDDFLDKALPGKMALAQQNLHARQMMFVFYRPLRPNELQKLAELSLQAAPVQQFTGADGLVENYYIYRVTKMDR